MMTTKLVAVGFVGVFCLANLSATVGALAPSFNRDVRPILAAKCFECHGPDEDSREADLRLDVREGAVADLGGYQAIKPGDPDSSELFLRITSDDPDTKMPPPDSGKSLTAEQIETLRDWIAGGGNYERHWAFVPPTLPQLPEVRQKGWPRNEIDLFVLARLEAEGLAPSPEADRYALARRVYLDLTGLPPTPEEADAFVQDPAPKAYENLVDQLLKSPHYGERWARIWLDLARYADTNGYEKDRPRSIWPYRDWVIRALNDDMPFDRFTIEQLAGDMLPGVTAAQQIATGFHRNTMLNEEGGIDPLEYRFYAMVDRVATTGTVWMGLTTGCAQCHSHKYDPITHTDYYRLMALLNNADEPDLAVRDADVLARRREIEQQIARLESELPSRFPPRPGDGPLERRRQEHLEQKFTAWLEAEHATATAWTVIRPDHLETNLPKLEVLADGSIFSSGDITKRDVFRLRFRLDELAKAKNPQITALRLEVLPDERLPAGGPGRAYYEGRKGDFFLSELSAKLDNTPVEFYSASHSYGKISIGSGNADAGNVFDGDGSTGWSTAEREGEPEQLVLNLRQPISTSGNLEVEMLFERHFAASLGRFRFSATSTSQPAVAKKMPVDREAILTRDPNTWSESERATLRHDFLRVAPELAESRKEIDKLQRQLPDFPETLVMRERPTDNPRETFRHHRGEYLKPREQVTPGIPEIFRQSDGEQASSSAAENQPADRLSFARWLASGRNPLAGRVTVNRSWQALFGHGLVRTSSDFGTQGTPPTHPELLDWLAAQFVAPKSARSLEDGSATRGLGWSLKSLHRLIVTSAAYRQSSRVTPGHLARDPENRLLARSPRLRVDAEMVRDIVLKASGMLSPKVGGPSVYPPQPASVTALAYGSVAWKSSDGEDRYRRSLYTFSKRTAPFAAYLVFDAPTGENCIARRERSNTPLQALTLMNDEMFLEMSRTLAKKAVESASSAESRAAFIFRRCVTRPPSENELASLIKFQQHQSERMRNGELDSAVICQSHDPTPELAAWIMVARAVMNLDETITK